MSRPTVRKQIELPAGATPTGVRARLRLVAATAGEAFGYAGTANVDIGGVHQAWADSNGLISFTNVRPNTGSSSDVITSPANTVYELVTHFPSRPTPVEYIQVPDQPGPLWAQDVLVAAPTALPSPGSVTTSEFNEAMNARPVKVTYRTVAVSAVAANGWYLHSGAAANFADRDWPVIWEGTTNQIPAQGAGDTALQVGDLAVTRTTTL